MEDRLETGSDATEPARGSAPRAASPGTGDRPAAASAAPAPPASAGGGVAGQLLEKARGEPGVRKLIDAFGAHVVDIRQHDAPETKKTTRAGDRVRHPEDAP